MKLCTRCKENLDFDKFSANKSTKDGLQTNCIECMRKYRREHYHKNKNQYYDRNTKTNAKLTEIILVLKNKGCLDCGVKYPGEPWLIEFDHLQDKQFNISTLRKSGSVTKLRSELEKCEVVCVICHRRRTAKRGGWKENPFVA